MENYKPGYGPGRSPGHEKPKGGFKIRSILLFTLFAFVAGGALAVWAAQKYGLLTASSGGQVTNGWAANGLAESETDKAKKVPSKNAPDLRTGGLNGGINQPVSAQLGAEASEAASDLTAQLSQINNAAAVAKGNAAQAEGMLLALAARRAIDSGGSLGYAEGQLQNRFGISNPRQVAAIVQAARNPVTIDILRAEMAAQGNDWLAPAGQSLWARMQNEARELFVLRTETTPPPAPLRRLERARYAVEAGNIDAAMAEVEKLPGAGQAAGWLARARTLSAVRKALDTIEQAALAPSVVNANVPNAVTRSNAGVGYTAPPTPSDRAPVDPSAAVFSQ